VPLQRVTSLRCRAQANAPATLNLRHVLDDSGRRDSIDESIVHGVPGDGACNAALLCNSLRACYSNCSCEVMINSLQHRSIVTYFHVTPCE